MKTMTEKQMRKHLATVIVPNGFTQVWDVEEPAMSLISSDIIIIFHARGDGTTRYLVEKDGNQWWSDFNRIGVESSFYHQSLFDEKLPDLNEIVAEQIDRARKRIEYNKTAIKIPGTKHSVAPGDVDKLKERLRKEGQMTFMPSGFGTGITITKRAPRNRWEGKRAPKDVEVWWGVEPLYIHTFDAD